MCMEAQSESGDWMDCNTCPNLRPESDPVIEEALSVYFVCSSQAIAGGFGIMGLNMSVMIDTAKAMACEITEELLMVFNYISVAFANQANEGVK